MFFCSCLAYPEADTLNVKNVILIRRHQVIRATLGDYAECSEEVWRLPSLQSRLAVVATKLGEPLTSPLTKTRTIDVFAS